MRSFREFLESDVMNAPDNIREIIIQTTNRIYNMEPKDVEDAKDVLLELQKILADKLA
jgi:hypothetical protein